MTEEEKINKQLDTYYERRDKHLIMSDKYKQLIMIAHARLNEIYKLKSNGRK